MFTDVECSEVCVYVYLYVGHSDELRKSSRADRDAIWGEGRRTFTQGTTGFTHWRQLVNTVE